MSQTIPGQVISLASRSRVRHLGASYDELGYPLITVTGYNLLAEKVFKDPTFLKEFKKDCLVNPMVYGRLLSWDRKATVIMASFFTEREFKEIFRKVNEMVKEEEDENHTFYLAGRVIEMGYLHKFMGYMAYIFGAAMAAIVLILFLAFGTWRGIFIPLLAGYVAVVWGLGSEYLLGMKMDIMTIIVPFMIMAIEVSHCVQIISRFYEEYARWGDNQKAAEETLKGLTIPSVTSIITDGAGFATMMLIPFKLLQQMGTSASYGVIRIFFTTTMFIHAFVAVIPPPTEKEMARIRSRNKIFKAILHKIAQLSFAPRSRRVVLGVTAAMLLLAIIGTNQVVVGDLQDGSPLFWADSEYNIADKYINKNFFGTSTYRIYIKGDRETVTAALANVEVAREIATLADYLEEREDVSSVMVYTDVLKAQSRMLHDSDPRFHILPKREAVNYQFLLQFVEGGGPEDSKPYFELDFGEGNMEVYVRNHKASTIHGIIRDTEEWIEKNHNKELPIEIQPAAGLIGIFSAIIDAIKNGQRDSLGQILLVDFLFVLISFGSFICGLMVMLVLGLGTLITFTTMGFGEIGLFIYTVPVASMGMGLGVDYTIYLVARMIEEKKAGKSQEEIHFESLTNAGKAIFFTAMSIALGVGILLLSAIRFQAILGAMLAVVLIANMLGALIVLPALINWWRPRFIFGK